MDAIVPKLENAGEVCKGNAKLMEKLETVWMTAAMKTDAQKRRVVWRWEEKWGCAPLEQIET